MIDAGGGILVIKFGALGDFVLATRPMEAIAAHHKGAHLTLVTTPPQAPLGRALGIFGEIWEDGRPRTMRGLVKLIRRIRRARFDRIYDLQTSERSSSYFQLLRPGAPEWSGIAWGASHPHANKRRNFIHTLERQAEQIEMAGVPALRAGNAVLPPDLSPLASRGRGPLSFGIAAPYALLVPGGSAHRPGKRWPAERYGALAAALAGRGLQPVIIGGPAEADAVATILAACPAAQSLIGATDFLDLIALGKEAALAIGNDTGPMHLLAAAGAASLVLFGPLSDPSLCAPRGRLVAIQRAADLSKLTLDEVLAALPR